MCISRSIPAALALLVLGAAPSWGGELYFSGNLAISSGGGRSGGAITFLSPDIPNTGSDSDSSPAYGGAVGFAFSPFEVLPEESWIPQSTIRVELEGTGGRDYELVTLGVDPYYTQVSSWSIMNNVWVDLPLHKPIAWAFGRVPVLEPLFAYAGAGVGLAGTELKTTDNVSVGRKEKFDVAWQVGAGLGYAITEFVSFQLGYRYLGLGNVNAALFAPQPWGNYSLDLGAHELSSALRVSFYRVDLPSWRD